MLDEPLTSRSDARFLEACALCGNSLTLQPVLSLGSSPPPCVMVPVGQAAAETHYPLELLRCEECTLMQLSTIVAPEVMFPKEYPYSSANSKQLHRNFEDLAADAWDMVGGLEPTDLVVDIGANDGTLLSKFGHCRRLAVDPTSQVRKFGGLHVAAEGHSVQAFFSEQVAKEIVERYGQARIVCATNVLAHVDDLADVMRGIKLLLAPNGVLIAENHALRSVIDGQWDMVYHEHLRFYTPHSFSRLLREHGLGSAGWRETGTHGGSFRMYATHATSPVEPLLPDDIGALQQRASDARRDLRKTLVKNAPVIGIGAAARATTIVNYCGLNVEDVSCVVEVPESDKLGHYIPGTRIPVVPEDTLFESDRPALLLSWHLADIVIPKLRHRGYIRPIIVPLPELHYDVSIHEVAPAGGVWNR